MKKLFSFLFLFGFLFSGCSLFGEKTIDIGVIAPIGFKSADIGEVVFNMINLSVSDVNSKGGINGHKINLIVYDGECSREGGHKAAEKLVLEHNVKYIVGGVCSDETLGAAEITELYNVILFSPLSSSDEITNAGDFVFRTVQTSRPGAELLAKFAIKNDIKNIVTLIELTEYTFSVRKGFLEMFYSLGGEQVASHLIDGKDSLSLTKFYHDLNNLSYDSILLLTQEQDILEGLILDIKKENITVPIFTDWRIREASLLKELGAEDLRIYYVHPLSSTDEKLLEEFDNKLKNIWEEYEINEDDRFYDSLSYDLVQILGLAISSCDDVYDTSCVRDYLYSMEPYKGYIVNISFDEFGDPYYHYEVREYINGSSFFIN